MVISEIRKAPGIMECVKMFFKNYVNFEGRSRRAEYWKFVLFNIIAHIPFMVVYGMFSVAVVSDPNIANHPERLIASVGSIGIIIIALYGLYGLACVIPNIAIMVRRLHDIGLSGYYALLLLLYFIPFINMLLGIAAIVLMCIDSKPETNEYGPSPKYIVEEEDMIQAN